MSIILNWNHVQRIVDSPIDAGMVAITNSRGESDGLWLEAKHIEVVGEGSMRVNMWLKELAEGNEETE